MPNLAGCRVADALDLDDQICRSHVKRNVDGLMVWQDWAFLPAARRHYGVHLESALALLLRCPT